MADEKDIARYLPINEMESLQNIRFHKFDEEQEAEAKAVASNDASGKNNGKSSSGSKKKGRSNFFSGR